MEELTLEFNLQNATEEQEQEIKKLQATIETDVDFIAANSMEEAYIAVKKYVKITLEQFKTSYEQIKEKVAGLFEEVQAKRELSDEELDIVAGGGLGSWLKKNWKKVAVAGAALAVVGCAAMLVGTGVAAVTGSMIGIGIALVGGASAATGVVTAAAGYIGKMCQE